MFAMKSASARRVLPSALGRLAPVTRSTWGVAPEPVADPLWMPLDVSSPVPLFDGPTPTKVTTLENGLKVASSDLPTPCTTIGLYVATGSKFETVSGTSHVLQHMAFKSTVGRSQLKMTRDCERLGASVMCTAARESMVYQIDTLAESVPEAIEMLAETTVGPKLLPWEIDAQAPTIMQEVADLASNHQALLQELIHPAAYGGLAPLGKPLYVKPAAVGAVDSATLCDFVASQFVPGKMVLSAAGYDHDELVGLAKTYFGGLPASSVPAPAADKYVGGENRVAADDVITHFALAFEGVGWESKQLVPLCVLNTMMGGGASFSAGGPGKGMYTRLYQNILNRYPSVEAASVFNAFYAGTGLFGVYGAAPAGAMGSLVAALVDELKKMTGAISEEELSRAKNQLTSSLLMNLESRPVLFEDIGRQTLIYGARVPPEQLVKEIAAVSAADLKAVATTMLKTPPSVAVYGDTTCVPRYDLIAKQFA
jgi:processing peptidase subunit alpha